MLQRGAENEVISDVDLQRQIVEEFSRVNSLLEKRKSEDDSKSYFLIEEELFGLIDLVEEYLSRVDTVGEKVASTYVWAVKMMVVAMEWRHHEGVEGLDFGRAIRVLDAFREHGAYRNLDSANNLAGLDAIVDNFFERFGEMDDTDRGEAFEAFVPGVLLQEASRALVDFDQVRFDLAVQAYLDGEDSKYGEVVAGIERKFGLLLDTLSKADDELRGEIFNEQFSENERFLFPESVAGLIYRMRSEIDEMIEKVSGSIEQEGIELGSRLAELNYLAGELRKILDCSQFGFEGINEAQAGRICIVMGINNEMADGGVNEEVISEVKGLLEVISRDLDEGLGVCGQLEVICDRWDKLKMMFLNVGDVNMNDIFAHVVELIEKIKNFRENHDDAEELMRRRLDLLELVEKLMIWGGVYMEMMVQSFKDQKSNMEGGDDAWVRNCVREMVEAVVFGIKQTLIGRGMSRSMRVGCASYLEAFSDDGKGELLGILSMIYRSGLSYKEVNNVDELLFSAARLMILLQMNVGREDDDGEVTQKIMSDLRALIGTYYAKRNEVLEGKMGAILVPEYGSWRVENIRDAYEYLVINVLVEEIGKLNSTEVETKLENEEDLFKRVLGAYANIQAANFNVAKTWVTAPDRQGVAMDFLDMSALLSFYCPEHQYSWNNLDGDQQREVLDLAGR